MVSKAIISHCNKNPFTYSNIKTSIKAWMCLVNIQIQNNLLEIYLLFFIPIIITCIKYESYTVGFFLCQDFLCHVMNFSKRAMRTFN